MDNNYDTIGNGVELKVKKRMYLLGQTCTYSYLFYQIFFNLKNGTVCLVEPLGLRV